MKLVSVGLGYRKENVIEWSFSLLVSKKKKTKLVKKERAKD